MCLDQVTTYKVKLVYYLKAQYRSRDIWPSDLECVVAETCWSRYLTGRFWWEWREPHCLNLGMILTTLHAHTVGNLESNIFWWWPWCALVDEGQMLFKHHNWVNRSKFDIPSIQKWVAFRVGTNRIPRDSLFVIICMVLYRILILGRISDSPVGYSKLGIFQSRNNYESAHFQLVPASRHPSLNYSCNSDLRATHIATRVLRMFVQGLLRTRTSVCVKWVPWLDYAIDNAHLKYSRVCCLVKSTVGLSRGNLLLGCFLEPYDMVHLIPIIEMVPSHRAGLANGVHPSTLLGRACKVHFIYDFSRLLSNMDA